MFANLFGIAQISYSGCNILLALSVVGWSFERWLWLIQVNVRLRQWALQ